MQRTSRPACIAPIAPSKELIWTTIKKFDYLNHIIRPLRAQIEGRIFRFSQLTDEKRDASPSATD